MPESADYSWIVRIGGLPVDDIDSLRSDLGERVREIANLEQSLAHGRSELVSRIEADLPSLPPAERREFLSAKRELFNQRRLKLSPRGLERLESISAGLSGTVKELEEALDAARENFEREYAEVMERQWRVLADRAGNTSVARGISLSSPILMDRFRQITGPRSRFGRKERKVEQSLLRYVTRAAIKLSPYSTLTRIGLASIEDAASPRFADPWLERSLLRSKRYIVEELRDLLLCDLPFRNSLPLRINPTLEQIGGGRFRVLRPARQTIDRAERVLKFAPAALVTASVAPDLVAWVERALAERLLSMGELCAAADFPLRTPEELVGVLEQLWHLGILVESWPWSCNVPELEARLGQFLAAEPRYAGVARELLRVVAAEASFAQAARPSVRVREIDQGWDAVWREAIALLPAPIDLDRKRREKKIDLYEDVFLAGGRPAGPALFLPSAQVEKILGDGSPLARLATLFSHHLDFRLYLAEHWRQEWPEAREIGLLELFARTQKLWQDFTRFTSDSRRRKGWHTFEPASAATAPLHALREWVWGRLSLAIRPGPQGVELSPDELEEILAEVPAEFLATANGCFFVQAADGEGKAWVLNRLFEGTGRYSSRYTCAMPPALRSTYAAQGVRTCEIEIEGEAAELVDLMYPQGDTLNVHATVTRRVVELFGELHELPPDRRLHLGELSVRLKGALPVVVDRQGKWLLPAHLGGVNLWFMPPLVKFVAAFGPGELPTLDWPRHFEPREGLNEALRLTCGCLIILRRRWLFSPSELAARLADLGSAEAFREVARWREELRLPERAFLIEPVSDGFGNRIYKPQYVDFSSPALVALLVAALGAEPSTLELEEVLPTTETAPRDGEGRRWAVEHQIESFAYTWPRGGNPARTLPAGRAAACLSEMGTAR